MKRLTLLLLCASAPAAADSPAPWIGEQVKCFEQHLEAERSKVSVPLTRMEARKIAARIERSCRQTYSHICFSARERASMAGADRYELTQSLLAMTNKKSN